jgi:hypothetical protein
MNPKDWMRALKPGDIVALHGSGFGYATYRAVVSSVTPSGRVRINDNRREFNPDGYERGSSGYRRPHIAQLTPAIEREMLRHQIINRLSGMKWEGLPFEVLQAVDAALLAPSHAEEVADGTHQ